MSPVAPVITTETFTPSINPRSRKVASVLASIENRQSDEQQKKKQNIERLTEDLEQERRKHETFAPKTNKVPKYLNLATRVSISERPPSHHVPPAPHDPDKTYTPKINNNHHVNNSDITICAEVRKNIRDLWAKHAEGSTMSVQGIMKALGDLGVAPDIIKDEEEYLKIHPNATLDDIDVINMDALDKYDHVIDKFLFAMGIDEEIEERRYAHYDRFCKVMTSVVKNAATRKQPTKVVRDMRVPDMRAENENDSIPRCNPPFPTPKTFSLPPPALESPSLSARQEPCHSSSPLQYFRKSNPRCQSSPPLILPDNQTTYSDMTDQERQVNSRKNLIEKKREDLGGLLRSRMSEKTVRKQQELIEQLRNREVSACTFNPEIVTKHSASSRQQSKSTRTVCLPPDPPGWDKVIERMGEGRRRAVPTFEEMLRNPVVSTNGLSCSNETRSVSREALQPKPFKLRSQERATLRQSNKPLLYVDVDLPKGKSGRIAVHVGDDPAVLASNFCTSYSLDMETKKKLTEILIEKINITMRAQAVRQVWA